MTIKVTLYPQARLTSACFYLLLPGFFIYHVMVGQQLFPALLGGYSTAMAVILLLPLSLAYALHLLQLPNHRLSLDIIYMSFIVYYAVLLLVVSAVSPRGAAALEQIGIVFQFLALFMVARLAPLGEHRFQRWLLIFLVIMTATIAFNADEGTFIIVALELQELGTNLANYQAYAFVYSVVALYVLAPIRQRWKRLLIYAVCIPALFVNGARTEFIGMILLVLLLEFMESKHKLMTLLVTCLLAAIGVAALPFLAEAYPESRTVFLFLDYSDDISAMERSGMLRDGWRSIMENPFLGSFGSYAPGAHIHNGLSAWVDLGLLGFVVYAGLIAVPMLDLSLLRRPDLRSPSYRLAFSMLFLSALFAVMAKHFTHQLLPLALGIYSRYLIETPRRRTSVEEFVIRKVAVA